MSQYYNTGPTRRRGRVTAFGVIAVLVALIAGGAGGYYLYGHQSTLTKLASLRGSKTNTLKTVTGQVVPALVNNKNSKDIGSLDPGQQLTLSFSLPLRNQAKLKALLKLQNDPQATGWYHHYLTPAQFNQDYSPSPEVAKEVADFLTASGLQVSSTSASYQSITAQASVGAIESAFHIQLHQYTQTVNGVSTTYYGPTSDPSVSSAIAGLIQHIGGLDNYSQYVSHVQARPNASGQGYGPAELQTAYKATPLISQGIDGSGQTIAFLELADYNKSDITNYQQQNNDTGGTFQTVPVDGGSKLGQGSIEVELDMEVAFAMAPKATELIYEGPNTNQGINDVYSQIVNDNKAKIVSISWGLCEQNTGSAELQTLDQIFQQGATEGISFFAAAGDNGAYDCGDGTVGVDSPADDPFVTGVGGTTLNLNSDGSIQKESAWSCTSAKCQQQSSKGEGTGGGVSAGFSIPDFQTSLSPSGAQGSGRFVPDVAADGDPQTGYAIVCTVRQASCSGNDVVGGTSGAAPLWAGTAALLSESLQQSNLSLGNANSALYAASKTAGALNDITAGNNLLYPAGPGYDLASGLGSPNTTTLAQALGSVTTGGGTGTGTGTPTPTPSGGGTTPTPVGTTTPQPPGSSGQNLIDNGGFENGTNPWVESSSGGYELIDTEKPHSGQYNADLCGYNGCDDIIGEAFTVPNDTSNLTLSYYWLMVTTESGSSCVDNFTVSLVTINGDGTLGNTIKTAQQSCNNAANNKYAKRTVDVSSDLSAYAGQDVALIFEVKGSGSNSTRVEVDDITLG